MEQIEIWKGKNAAGGTVELRYVPALDTYYFIFNDRINDLVSLDESEIGRLLYSFTDFMVTRNTKPEEIERFMEEQRKKNKKNKKKEGKE